MIMKSTSLHNDPTETDSLPERVELAILSQQDAGERLVGWFQLAVLILFGFLYFVSPKTFSADKTFTLVPWFLGVWLLLTLARLLWSYRTRLPACLLYVSIVADMGLLLGMIWAFHIQYDQPPSFYLKAPTLLYVFVFIALRALRFEARYVIAAGVVAALGWSALAAYAIYATGGMEIVTRNYVHYLTSNSVLKGAELDKVVTILTVTAILAVAITQARKLLIRAVAQGTAAKDLSRFFAPEVAQQIPSAEKEITIGKGQVREAAILMVDIRGFTRLSSQIRPDDLMGLLTAYQARLVPIIQQHAGTIDKFLGDGIMATFGAATASSSFAADALQSVERVMQAAESWAKELQRADKPVLTVGAAVTTGQIVFGAVGDTTRMEYTVIGDVVNLAAKLEKQTKVESVRALCTAVAWDTALQQGYQPAVEREIRHGRTIEGVNGPQDIVVLAK